MSSVDPAQPLKDFEPKHDILVGIDSDGTVFDTMGIKQRECFCPWLIGFFGLQPVAQAVRDCKEFADLFSNTRGFNRHKTAKRIIADLLPNHPMTRIRKFEVPQYPHYFAWVDDPDSILSDDGLRKAIDEARDPEARKELELALAWSLKVNEAVAFIVKDMPPFPYVRECLEKLREIADIIVVSGTPCEALEREWQEHDLARYVDIIAGQEMGGKEQHLKYVTAGKYERDRVLVIGDSPGDVRAAKANDVLFYPINPGAEVESWKRFHDEILGEFVKGQYNDAYEAKLIVEFYSYLPKLPPWQR